MTTDPVCGMKIDESAAKNVSEYGKDVFYFCSSTCKSKFDGKPDIYAR